MSTPITLPPLHATVIRATWIAIVALLVLDAAWLVAAHIGFPLKTLALIAGASVVLGAISFVYRRIRPDDALWFASEIANQLVLGSCALGTFNYLGLRFNYPLMDAAFDAVDKRLGFDWLSYIGWVDGHPQIARLFTICYISTGPEILVIIAILCFCRRFPLVHRYVLCYLLSGFVTILIGDFWPATTAYLYRHIPPAAYPHLQIAEASAYGSEFFAMRGHVMSALPESFQGLVAFPSFHSTLAVLAIYAVLGMPSMILRLLLIALNTVMLLSTPVDGGHYLVDTLSGIALGFAVIACVPRLLPDLQRRDGVR